MNLHNFESWIDKKIVARGYDYYKKDCVISVEEPEKNVYVAEVDKSLSPADKGSIFQKLIEEAAHRRYEDWTDWRLDLLGRCSELADTPVLRNKLENHLIHGAAVTWRKELILSDTI